MSLVVISAATWLLLPAAQAQVIVDPDSPAAKEYAIPLDEGREKSGGGTNSSGGSDSSLGASSSSSGGNDGASSGDRKKGTKGKDSSKLKKDESDAGESLAASGSNDGGGGGSSSGPDEAGTDGAMLTSGIALAVLLLGGGIAFLMRRGAFGTDAQ